MHYWLTSLFTAGGIIGPNQLIRIYGGAQNLIHDNILLNDLSMWIVGFIGIQSKIVG